jgi:competence protein ComEC
VTSIEYADVRILLCSDIEQFAQRTILSRYPTLRADVIVVPHHGSRHTLTEGFLAALRPSVLISSQAEQAQAATREPVRLSGATTLTTAANGAITIRVYKSGLIEAKTCAIPERD